MSKQIDLKFHGIDYWSRPVFKAVDKEWYFGSLEKLICSKEEYELLKDIITSDDLLFFGTEFDCEPLGTEVEPKLNIIWS